eukprot:jgi/Mesvir1/16168/Mv08435-RA.1
MAARMAGVLACGLLLAFFSACATADVVPMDVYDDVYMTGNCSRDIQIFCKDVQPGFSRLSECLTKQIRIEKNGLDPEVEMVSSPCKAELREFKIERAQDITIDTKMEEACRPDIPKFCNDTDLYPEWGSTIACLREMKDQLTSKCAAQIFRSMEQASEDFKLDALVNKFCAEDAKELCGDVEEGEGRVLACMRSKRWSLSWDCQEELFRMEVENADDLRLDAVLRRACMADKDKFCPEVRPGNARVKDCLEDHRNDPGFSVNCKAQFESMMERRAADFRLDAPLREFCAKDIEVVCGYEKDSLDAVAGYDGRVIECLQDYKEELTSPECKERVHKLTVRAGQDIRFDVALADACYEDRSRLCANIAPGSARVIRCLQDLREQLSYECRATLFDQEVRMAEDIDFMYPLKTACTKDIDTFCKGVPHGHARVIQCLRDHVHEVDMATECKNEIKRDEQRAAEDYRLNYRLNRACDADIDLLCADACSPFMGQACGGVVLACLIAKQANVTSEACKKEVFEVEKMQVDDFRNNAILREACKEDYETFCSDVAPGEGLGHKCLREHRADLSEKCRLEEDKLAVVQYSDVRLQPQLHKLCSTELNTFCKDVVPGQGRQFACLLHHINDVEFSSACAAEVRAKEDRRASNYKLDAGVSTACKKDVAKLCSIEDEETDGDHADVMMCLVDNSANVEEPCAKEMGRAVKAALWQYRKRHPLTFVCDNDFEEYCKDLGKPGYRLTASIVAGPCLTKRFTDGESLNEQCKTLVGVTASSEIPDSSTTGINAALLAKKVVELEKREHGIQGGSDGSGIELTGWIALASVGSLVLVVIGAGVFVYRKYRGPERPYTLVVKGGDV